MIKERSQLSMEHQNNTSVPIVTSTTIIIHPRIHVFHLMMVAQNCAFTLIMIVAQHCGFTSILVSFTQYKFHALFYI